MLSRFHLRERIHDPDSVFRIAFKGLTFWILNKNFQETASLSIVLRLFIHKISSKNDRDHNIQAEFKRKGFSHSSHASPFCEDVRFRYWTFFDMQLMNFIQKYFLLFILDF